MSSVQRYTGWTDERLQERIRRLVDSRSHQGLTVAELRMLIPDNEAHHGWISGALAILHGDLRIARLKDKRLGCKVYVHPDFLDGRNAEKQGRDGPSRSEVAWLQSMESLLEYWLQVDSEGAKFTTSLTKADRHHRLFLREMKALWVQRQ